MNDEAPIHIRYQWTTEEFVRAHKGDARHEVEMVMREDGLKAATVGMASSEMGWNAFCKAVIAPEGVLLFLTPQQYRCGRRRAARAARRPRAGQGTQDQDPVLSHAAAAEDKVGP
ncbi:MAG: hypothetical protein O7C98_01475 [Planctomycetota bacterium]|nr:hypothetical protein [Planctomycetota bacterium]